MTVFSSCPRFPAKRFRLLAIAIYLSGIQLVTADPGSLVIFGDSWSDTGNDRRFTDGLVWHEYLAHELGLETATPSFEGGSNHAIGGLRIANREFDDRNDRRSFRLRVDDYLENNTPAADDLFFIWSGTPDFLVDHLFDADAVATRVAEEVTRLAAAGANRFVLGNVPLIGQTPWGRGTENNNGDIPFGTLDTISQEYDSKVRTVATQLASDLGVHVGVMDVMSIHGYVLENPCRPDTFCDIKDRGGDLFVDNIHFRTRFHEMLVEPAKVGLGLPESSRVVGGWKSLGRDIHWDDISVTADGMPTQSSDHRPNTGAGNAIDSDLLTTSRTSGSDQHPSWQLEFSEPRSIRSFTILNGRGGTRETGLTDNGGLLVEVFNGEGPPVWEQEFLGTPIPDGRLEFAVPEDLDVVGQVLRLSKIDPVESGFNIAEVDVISDVATYLMSPVETWVFEIDADSNNSDSIGFQNELDINGSNLQVDLLQGELGAGDTFDLFDASSITGSFSKIDLPDLGDGLQWLTENLALDGTISVAALTGNLGDFDKSGSLDADDINLLSGAIGKSDNLTFDLNGDGVVSELDHAAWIEASGVIPGDADFNGTVNFADFLVISANFGGNGGWDEGDFDGSGDIKFSDFLFVSSNFGSTKAAAVPEPSGMFIALVATVVGVSQRRRRPLRDHIAKS